MESANLTLLIAGIFVGYLLKGFFSFRSTFTASNTFVNKVADQALKLLGTTVYKVSFMDQIYKKSIAMAHGKEHAKICNNELEYEFEIWKKETISVFIENYPENYKWQLEVTDWQTAMKALTDIYKTEKTESDEKL